MWLEDVLRAEPGLDVATLNGPSGWPWQKHGHGDFLDIWGVMAHHTGGSHTPATEIRDGVRYADGSTLKGPLSQIHLAKSGLATIVAVGIAWHAGRGSYPGLPTNNANYHTIGIEAQNNGTEGWSHTQYWAYVRTVAAILRRLGYNSSRVIGHKEYSGHVTGKWDPGGMNMDKFRADVQEVIDGAPAKPVRNEIDHTYSFSGWLGDRLFEGEREALDGGRYVDFEAGSIYWHPETGSLPVPSLIYETWREHEWERGFLGYPEHYHVVVSDDSGVVGDVQQFEGGRIARKHGQPGHTVYGVIGDRWAEEGDVRGPLGWPISEERDHDDGRVQDFEHGSLFWSPTGAVRMLD